MNESRHSTRVLVTGNKENQKKQLTKKSILSSRALKMSVEQRCVRFSLDICSVFIDDVMKTSGLTRAVRYLKLIIL